MNARRHASHRGPTLWLWLALALLVLVLDQLTKWLIVGQFVLGDSRPVTSFFNLVRAHNTGAAFSFLAQAGGWQRWLFTGIGIAASALMVWMLRAHPGQKLFGFAVACVLGGAIGNHWSLFVACAGFAVFLAVLQVRLGRRAA